MSLLAVEPLYKSLLFSLIKPTMSANCILTVVQMKSRVGDIAYNTKTIIRHIQQARNSGSHLVLFPELCLTGYLSEDLLNRPLYQEQVTTALHQITAHTTDIAALIGFPRIMDGKMLNAAGWIENGETQLIYDKLHLPNYETFDEKRYFSVGNNSYALMEYRNIRFAVAVCEDIWCKATHELADKNQVDILLSLNASPFFTEKFTLRQEVIGNFCNDFSHACVYCNAIGGHDDLVFDGGSFIVNASGKNVLRMSAFREKVSQVIIRKTSAEQKNMGKLSSHITFEAGPIGGALHTSLDLSKIKSIYEAIRLAIYDYVTNSGFKRVIIGLSGGIDSAVTLTLAVSALGAEQVEAVMMPFHYTSDMSKQDAQLQCDWLKVKYQEIPIADIYDTFTASLSARFAGLDNDLTEENLQARIRGVILMAIANKTDSLVLSTGNKSEYAVGYSTLYGDMVGAFAPLKDVLKMEVYELAHYCNQQKMSIPESVISRPPSAELAPNQTDQDALPDYEVLDKIIEGYMVNDRSKQELIADGFEQTDVERVVKLIYQNEYKRRQSPPGPKISQRSLTRDRRYPIANGFKEEIFG